MVPRNVWALKLHQSLDSTLDHVVLKGALTLEMKTDSFWVNMGIKQRCEDRRVAWAPFASHPLNPL